MLTVFNVETEFNVHTISEINYRENAKIIADKINGDELIFKEIIDAHLISTCVKFPAISTLIYDLLNSEGKKLEKIQLSDIQLESGTSMKAVKHSCIDKDWTVLGIERSKSIPELSPSNDIVLDKDDKIIVIA